MWKQYLPSAESIRRSRFVAWLGPGIQQPCLWHPSRRAVAKGVAIGAFFGLMVPVAQIPVAAAIAFFLRANLWVSATATFITNPLTFGPLYYFAYQIGVALLGVPEPATAEELAARATSVLEWLGYWFDRFLTHGQPLLLGLLLMAICTSVTGYFLTQLLWRVRVRIKRRSLRMRRARRRSEAGSGPALTAKV